ncbi:regulatory protein MsaA [Staphylococcus sp. SQ8-PEA]|uniref:Regulatory protein MsaA n=1 Tax=Staphylococcus marylandisciuri TaxID=2981529 RepID=A0ABT2QNH6_9STAP|nr:regulatory protein MsaA [Staphylococcus marylandisciuri]MCU5745540.1 regulatory protein MsaA [Staphylococcus marylandisciuri]
MWTVTKIRADYEGWWLFSDWTDCITDCHQYHTYEKMLEAYQKLIDDAKSYYDNYVVGKYNIYAFYNNCDLGFCEDCGEDLQIFYSFIVLNNNEVFYNLPILE